MEKLLKLLNEYDSGWDYDDYYGPYQYGQDRDAYIYGKYYLVSRDYGFIKWLVENEKIDGEKFQEPKMRGIIGLISNWHNSEGKSYKDYSKELAYESLLMLLSISDTPIKDLISYLK